MPATACDHAMVAPNQSMCTEVVRSSLFTMLPTAVRSRIPVLSSIRRSAKAVVFSGAHNARRKAYTISSLDSNQDMYSVGFASTVPNSELSTPTLRPQTPEESIRTSELSLTMLPQPMTESGVKWDVATTGIRLWTTAKQQAEQNGDSAALRSMHIDAVRYMHMALPSDLTPLEINSLRASMPVELLAFPESPSPRIERPPTILRRSVAQLVCWALAIVLFVVPVVMAFLNRALQIALNVERRHQVTERLLSNSLDIVSAFGEQGSRLQQPMARFKDGPLGNAFLKIVNWFMEGVLGGVNDGIEAIAQRRPKAA
ncbi:hypothetical protein B0A52_06006 [Exophiala mesophila]|uniref:Uncharacterized protein n=1 Tax=Exophiala mesophila TaxID=212818 RepID=A0A438N5L5_EXOME|nr:hypothetical protein B0A52_06006 [Exophiala mesophila]